MIIGTYYGTLKRVIDNSSPAIIVIPLCMYMKWGGSDGLHFSAQKRTTMLQNDQWRLLRNIKIIRVSREFCFLVCSYEVTII